MGRALGKRGLDNLRFDIDAAGPAAFEGRVV
jgi:hypothetical protein